MATTAQLQEELADRLEDLDGWLHGAFETCELRDAESVRAAKGAYVQWARVSWDGDEGDAERALSHAWEMHVEEVALRWTRQPGTFAEDFRLSVDPVWDIAEFYLVAASVFAESAVALCKKATARNLALAAMLYADAVDARETWMRIRGFDGCRNPKTRLGAYQARLRAIDDEFAVRMDRKKSARQRAKKKLERDPKQAAKASALNLWKERHAGHHPKLRTVEQFATEVMRRWPVLSSAKVICGWSAKWSKASAQGREPSLADTQ